MLSSAKRCIDGRRIRVLCDNRMRCNGSNSTNKRTASPPEERVRSYGKLAAPDRRNWDSRMRQSCFGGMEQTSEHCGTDSSRMAFEEGFCSARGCSFAEHSKPVEISVDGSRRFIHLPESTAVGQTGHCVAATQRCSGSAGIALPGAPLGGRADWPSRSWCYCQGQIPRACSWHQPAVHWYREFGDLRSTSM
jgi:hypothetical protein